MPIDTRVFGSPFEAGTKEAKVSGAGVERVPGNPTETDPNAVFAMDDVDQLPVAIFAPKPVYPEYLREARVTGAVLTEVQVNADGTVARVVVKSGLKLFADSAQDALYRWRFRPATVHGRAVAVRVQIPVNFIL